MPIEKPKLYDVEVSDYAEIAGAFLENKETDDIRKRVNPFDMVGVRINSEAPFAKAEEEATKNFLELAKNYPLVIWFSPPGGVYTEGRINIGRVVENDRGKTRINGKGIAVKWSAEKMLTVAERILDKEGTVMDEFFDVEGMRRQPIGIDTRGINWIDKCEELMPELNLIWDYIRIGGDERAKKELTEIVSRVLQKTGYDNVAFEREMANQGQIITGGNHGGTYTGGERGTGIIIMRTVDGQITYRMGGTEGMTQCPKCGCWYSGEICPCIKK
jgi:hypothetical protein